MGSVEAIEYPEMALGLETHQVSNFVWLWSRLLSVLSDITINASDKIVC